MVLMLDALETCVHALEICVPGCTSRSASLFFMLEVRGPQRASGHVAASEPTSPRRRGPELYDTWQRRSSPQPGGEVRSHMTRVSVKAHLSWEARSRAIGHVAALEPTSAWRRGPELQGTWQRRSPPQLGGEVRSHWTRGSIGAHLSKEARFEAIGRGSAWMHALLLVLT
jgi:hypothetical protein